MMSSFFKPARGARRKVAGASLALGLTQLLGVSPLLALTPVAAQPAPASPAQQATTQETPARQVPQVQGGDPASKLENVDLKVTTGPLNISQGGIVSVTTSPLSAEFRQKYTFHELALVERGSTYVHVGHHNYVPLTQYGGMVRDLKQQGNVRENPDGSLTFTLVVPAHVVEAPEGTLFDTVLTYYPSNEYAPDPLTWSNRRITRTPTDVVQDAKPTKTTYLFSSPSIEHPEEDTTLTVEGFHILSKSTFWGPEGPAVLTLYEVDPVTGQGIGSPVFMQNLNYTRCNQYCDSFLNDHFSTAITIPGGTLKAGRLYRIGFYGGGYPGPGSEEYPGAWMTDVADFIPVGTPEQDAAPTSIYVSGDKMSPYRENNTLKVTVLGLPPHTKGYYRFSLQPIDDHGRPTGQKSWEKVIPAESIQKGRTAQTLSLPGYALNFEVAYRLFVEKVTPNQGDAVDSVEQVASKDLDLDISQEREMEAARKWIVNRQILPGYPTDRDWESVNRRSVTVALYRLAGAPQVELPAVSPYTDITPDDPDYTAIIWARQRGITFGWVDGRFHPNEPLSDRSTAAFLYRYQRSQGEASPSLPTSPSLPDSNPKKQKHFPLSSHWRLWISPETAFSRESRWAIEQRIWGYMPDQGYFYESFDGFKMSYRQVAVMLYRMEHGGSHLR